MEGRTAVRTTMRSAILVAATVLAAPASAQPGDTQSCAATIRALIADIAARDLDTSRGPPHNAFLALNTSAVAQAEQLDRAAGPKRPLHCVPVAVKDNFDTHDMPMTAGSLALAGNRPPGDAALVKRLREAGAIIIGKTNMDEFAFGIAGISGAGGRVGNAYDPRQSAGGRQRTDGPLPVAMPPCAKPYSVPRSSGTSPNRAITTASLKSPMSGSPLRRSRSSRSLGTLQTVEAGPRDAVFSGVDGVAQRTRLFGSTP